MREKSTENKTELLYGYFMKHAKNLTKFFKFENDSFITNIRLMNSITDHYISDYKNYNNTNILKKFAYIIDNNHKVNYNNRKYHNALRHNHENI